MEVRLTVDGQFNQLLAALLETRPVFFVPGDPGEFAAGFKCPRDSQ